MPWPVVSIARANLTERSVSTMLDYGKYITVADRYQRKARYQDREDLNHTIILTLAILQVVYRFILDSLFYGGYSFSLNLGVIGVGWADLVASLLLLEQVMNPTPRR